MSENEIQNTVMSEATDEMSSPANVTDAEESGALLRELGELRQELESMRRELAETNSARQRAVADRASAAELSAGRLRGAADSLYSPSEVRAMSRREVRANLDRIRESMRHWN